MNERSYSQQQILDYYHLDHNKKTLKYYIAATSEDDVNYTWTTDVSPATANEIKTEFVNSMKQWNDVYFYSYDQNGARTKNKVINIEEGTATDYNIIIYPTSTGDDVASSDPLTSGISIGPENFFKRHNHHMKFYINVNISYFHLGRDDLSYEEIEVNKKRAGAHEVGHILGLDDLDVCCQEGSGDHHEEVLMGYAGNNENKQQNITYKDLAGVAITRGFHTDSDHRWLVDTDQLYNGQYKKICSICNGIEYVSSLSGNYYEYNYCQGVHTLSSNNMMAVGCKGDQDFIKCKYCRYVAPVEDMVTQVSTIQNYNSYQHKLINTVSGLSYTIYEDHSYTYSQYSDSQHKSTCLCGYVTYEEHIFTPLPYNQEKHRLRCACGYVEYQNHSITETDYSDGDSTALCIICNGFININTGIFDILPNSITKYSINGSFILPNGVVVLVDEDIESYLNNTLIFYEEEDILQIE